MNRLMLILFFAFATLFGAQAALAQTLSTEVRKTAQSAPQKGSGAFGKPAPTVLSWHVPFMPTDTVWAQKEAGGGAYCDENGYLVSGPSNWKCTLVSSRTTGLTYSVQARQIFAVQNGNSVLYVRFAQSSSSSRVEYMSPAAEQFALANGYRLDKTTNIMVATNAPPAVAQAPIDCKTKVTIENMSQRKNCVNASTQTAAAPPQAATPQVAQVPKVQNCANETNLLKRISCEAAAAGVK